MMPSETLRYDQSSILLSLVGALVMALLGEGFAALTASEAIMLDGLYSLVMFVMGFVSLQVSKMGRLPHDDRYPFGYATFEPLLNLSKGLIISSPSLLALYSAIEALFIGVDYKNWAVDGAISRTVAIAFFIAWCMQTTRWAAYVPYVDPLLVIVIVAMTANVPWKISTTNLKELLNAAPEPS
jgi:predicted Co/Zn/Cd cation transporter (cation efflux family)